MPTLVWSVWNTVSLQTYAGIPTRSRRLDAWQARILDIVGRRRRSSQRNLAPSGNTQPSKHRLYIFAKDLEAMKSLKHGSGCLSLVGLADPRCLAGLSRPFWVGLGTASEPNQPST